MNGLERVRKALKREEPNRVPHFELGIHEKVREAIKPGASYEDFIEFMDIDAIGLGDLTNSMKFTPIDEVKKVYRDQWGATVRFSEESAPPCLPSRRSSQSATWKATCPPILMRTGGMITCAKRPSVSRVSVLSLPASRMCSTS